MSNIQTLPLALLKKDPRVQQRASLNQAVVELYQEAMQAGDKFPAMLAFKDGADYWLVSGFHRAAAYQALGVDVVDVEIAPGTMRDAILHAVGDNAAHGLQRTVEDKRRAIDTLLNDPDWAKWNDSEIARRCKVDRQTVTRRRAALAEAAPADSHLRHATSERTYTTKHGTEATMATGNIGRQAEPEPAPAPPAAAERQAADYEASTPAAPAPAPAPAAPPAESELEEASDEELKATMAEHDDKLAALEAIVDADDKLKAAVEKIAQQAERIRLLEERVRGLTNECAMATRLAKSWRLKFERSGKA